jgi:hypothetical protein
MALNLLRHDGEDSVPRDKEVFASNRPAREVIVGVKVAALFNLTKKQQLLRNGSPNDQTLVPYY